MAIKIGKWYITRNNPRELLLQLRNKQDVIDKAIEYIKLYSGYDNNFCLDYHELNPLLNILQNGSEDNGYKENR